MCFRNTSLGCWFKYIYKKITERISAIQTPLPSPTYTVVQVFDFEFHIKRSEGCGNEINIEIQVNCVFEKSEFKVLSGFTVLGIGCG